MKNIFPKLILCLSLVAGCTLDDADYVLIEELDYVVLAGDGTFIKDDGTYAVPAEGGSISFRLLANAPVTLVPRGGMPQWAETEKLSFEGDADFTVTMGPNEGFRRGVIFDVSLEGSDKKMVLVAKQDGLVPVLECPSPIRQRREARLLKSSSQSEPIFQVKKSQWRRNIFPARQNG